MLLSRTSTRVATAISAVVVAFSAGLLTGVMGSHDPDPSSNAASLTAPVQAVAFSPDARSLATGEPGGKVCLWNTATGQLMSQLSIPADMTVDGIRFSNDGRTLAAVLRGSDQSKNSTCQLFVWSGDGDL